LGGFCFCFPVLLHPGISLLQRTLCTPDHPLTQIQIHFLKTNDLRVCLIFLFSLSYSLSVPTKMSAFILFLKNLLQIFSDSLSMKYSYLDSKLQLGA
jgi:hypothetical protein